MRGNVVDIYVCIFFRGIFSKHNKTFVHEPYRIRIYMVHVMLLNLLNLYWPKTACGIFRLIRNENSVRSIVRWPTKAPDFCVHMHSSLLYSVTMAPFSLTLEIKFKTIVCVRKLHSWEIQNGNDFFLRFFFFGSNNLAEMRDGFGSQ